MRVSTSQLQLQGVNAILDQQSALSKTQLQLSTGKRIVTASDDPAGAAQALQLNESIGKVDQYKTNADNAALRVKTEDSVLDQVGTALQRIRELTVQAGNDSQTPDDRKAIASEVEQRLAELVQYANSQDGNGEYLFGGLKSRTQPFTTAGTAVSYNGDQGERSVQVGPDRQLPVTHTGFDIFMRIANGNGSFVTAGDSANTGSASISAGSVTDSSQTTDYPYTVSFGTNANGDKYYMVTGASGPVVPPTGLPADAPLYQSGQAIEFDGLQMTVEGDPDVTDTFTVSHSQNQSMFKTVQNLVDALKTVGTDTTSKAQFHTQIGNSLDEIDNALNNVLRVRAEAGARMNSLDSEVNANASAKLDLQTALSQVQDLDYASAISKLNQQSVGLQAAQQSYVKIQGLSLFNYL